MTLVVVGLTALLLVCLLAGYRYALRPVVVGICFGLGPLLLVGSAGRLDLQVFTWVKVLTLAFTMAIVTWFPRAKEPVRGRLAWVLAVILVLNILEAVAADAFGGRWLNALVGVSLVITVAGPSRITTTVRNGRPAVLYDLPWSWVWAYTLWNLTVVCGTYPLHWCDHLAVLAVPLIAALAGRDRRLWLEARAFSLSVYAVGIVLVVDWAGGAWIPESPSPAAIYPLLVGAAVGLAGWNGVAWIVARRGSAGGGSAGA